MQRNPIRADPNLIFVQNMKRPTTDQIPDLFGGIKLPAIRQKQAENEDEDEDEEEEVINSKRETTDKSKKVFLDSGRLNIGFHLRPRQKDGPVRFSGKHDLFRRRSRYPMSVVPLLLRGKNIGEREGVLNTLKSDLSSLISFVVDAMYSSEDAPLVKKIIESVNYALPVQISASKKQQDIAIKFSKSKKKEEIFDTTRRRIVIKGSVQEKAMVRKILKLKGHVSSAKGRNDGLQYYDIEYLGKSARQTMLAFLKVPAHRRDLEPSLLKKGLMPQAHLMPPYGKVNFVWNEPMVAIINAVQNGWDPVRIWMHTPGLDPKTDSVSIDDAIAACKKHGLYNTSVYKGSNPHYVGDPFDMDPTTYNLPLPWFSSKKDFDAVHIEKTSKINEIKLRLDKENCTIQEKASLLAKLAVLKLQLKNDMIRQSKTLSDMYDGIVNHRVVSNIRRLERKSKHVIVQKKKGESNELHIKRVQISMNKAVAELLVARDFKNKMPKESDLTIDEKAEKVKAQLVESKENRKPTGKRILRSRLGVVPAEADDSEEVQSVLWENLAMPMHRNTGQLVLIGSIGQNPHPNVSSSASKKILLSVCDNMQICRVNVRRQLS